MTPTPAAWVTPSPASWREATGRRIEYRDPDRAYANTTLPALCGLIAQRLADEQAAPDHPLAAVRAGIIAAFEAREG